MKRFYLKSLVLLGLLAGGVSAQNTAYYVVKHESGEAYSIDMKTPAQTEKAVASGLADVHTMADALIAGDVVDKYYYLLKYDGMEDADVLLKVDPATGKSETIGNVGTEYTDMTYDASTQIMYAVKGTALYSVSLADAAETKLKDLKESTGMLRGIAANSEGVLYTLNKTTDGKFTLNTIDPKNGYAYAQVCELSLEGGMKNINTRQSIDFDKNDELYWLADIQISGYTYTYHTAKIDVTTGAISLLGDLSIKYSALAMAEMTGGEDPEPDPEPETVQRVKYVYLMGDAMGASEGATKATEYFYGTENQLLRTLELSKNSESGEMEPYTYTKYVSSVDEAGNTTVAQCMRKKVAGGGSSSDLDRYWQAYDSIDVTVYDAAGKTISYTKVGNTRVDYTYEGNNLIEEEEVYVTGGSMDGKIKGKKFYSNFVAGQINCPQTVLVGSIYDTSVAIQEYKYDEFGNKIECITYKTAGALADEDGIYYEDAQKGEPKQQEIWTYDDKGRMTKYVKNVKYKNEAWAADFNNRKTTYEYINDTTYIHSYSGDGASLDGWYESPAYTKEVNGTFNGSSALNGFSVKAKEGEVGIYLLTAEAPAVSVGDYLYKVYRDGEEVGEMKANPESGQMEYEDKIGKGIHDWFVLTYDNMREISMNISDAVELDVAIQLNPVTEITVVKNEIVEDEVVVTVEWKAVETEGAVLQGYNFYTNVVNLEQAVPTNGENLITETTYTYSWVYENMAEGTKKDFWVEAVYDWGKVKSAKQTVELAIPTGIDEVNASAKLMISDNMITVDGYCKGLSISNVSGACVAKAAGNEINIETLSSGVYVLTVKMADRVYSVKFVK